LDELKVVINTPLFGSVISQYYQIVIGQQLVVQLREPNIQQLVGLIPWGHNILIFIKLKGKQETLFYIKETITNNWSRNVLVLQIKSNLHARQGIALANFERILPKP